MDKNCYVARSRCHLALGDTRKALADAENALTEDKGFHKVNTVSSCFGLWGGGGGGGEVGVGAEEILSGRQQLQQHHMCA